MIQNYTVEKNVQLLVAHLKAHNIKKVIASPGTQHMAFLGSLQFDGSFEIYSCVDERSAAYMAVGMAAESGEPVVICCTGATASRNYLPALTEAFYRKLPIIAVTGTHEQYFIGHLIAQQIDRNRPPNDIVVHSELIERINEEGEYWDVEIKINRALRMLKRNGGGPIHLNLETRNNSDFNVEKLPIPRIIDFIDINSDFPKMGNGPIAIFCGSHNVWSKDLTDAVNDFCGKYNAVVFCDHTSNYMGKYRIEAQLLGSQELYKAPSINSIGTLIHIGEITGAYEVNGCLCKAKQTWRISEDGTLRDTFKNVSKVFDMTEEYFFKHYASLKDISEYSDSYLKASLEDYKQIYDSIPEDIPFSNIWIAKTLCTKIPEDSIMHFSILNSLRSWNYFKLPQGVTGYCNVGGFGIDGPLSTMIGASLCHPEKLYIGIVGDLSFFYDMNALGNRHVGNNVRLLMINNGLGQEFRNYIHPAYAWGDSANEYVAAARHFGNKSTNLMKHMAEDLGYEYMTASSKEEVEKVAEKFLTKDQSDRPMFFEIFTNTEDEGKALFMLKHAKSDIKQVIKNKMRNAVKETLGENTLKVIKKTLK